VIVPAETAQPYLIEKARAGDDDAFRELTEPHRRELQVHCYRMLGSLQDAEDAVQDALLAAWQGFGGFEGRASPRTWLYRIATNRCLNALRAASRRPAADWKVPGVEPPAPTRLGEALWLEPYPDALLEGVIDAPPGPEARYEQAESISLAFVAALQVLPPRQVAVLILRDVLGFRAAEVAAMLDSTVESVNSALKRARARLDRARLTTGQQGAGGREQPPAPGPPAEDALVAKFTSAYEAADLDTLVRLLTDDVFISMPPVPFEYEGRDLAASFFGGVFGAGRRFDLVPTRANGQPAFGAYLRGSDPTEERRGTGLITITITGMEISATSRFESGVLPWFGLPPSLPAAAAIIEGGVQGVAGSAGRAEPT
jgi:RNA polymerase sigma-70 factor (TIGR02960 family)